MTHVFVPDPDYPKECVDCTMPKINRVHDAPAVAAAAPLPSPTRNAVNLSPHATQKSYEAGLRAFPRSGTIKAELLTAIHAADPDRGMTDEELQRALPRIGVNSLRPRRVDLMKDGWLQPVRIADTGRDVTRGGFTAWRLTPIGRRQWSEHAG